jgi:NADH-quinone oxidoreductase subunit G
LISNLAGVVLALAEKSSAELSEHLRGLVNGYKLQKEHISVADSLRTGKNSAVIVGIQALGSPHLSLIQELCEAISSASESSLGYLSPSVNSAGACLAGSLPHRLPGGVAVKGKWQHTQQILNSKHEVLLGFGINPVLDISQAALVQQLAANNDFIIAINSYANQHINDQADLVLPLAGFAETSGTFVNVEGLWQSFKGCIKAEGASRQGWKILTALGQILLPGDFDYPDSATVKNEVRELCRDVSLNNLCGIESTAKRLPVKPRTIQKIGIAPIYASDDLARLSAPLQATPIMTQQCSIAMNRQLAEKSDLVDSEQVQIRQGEGTAILPLIISEDIPNGCVYIPTGIEKVKNLGDAIGVVELERVS